MRIFHKNSIDNVFSQTSATNRQRFQLILPKEPRKPMYYGFRQNRKWTCSRLYWFLDDEKKPFNQFLRVKNKKKLNFARFF